MNTYYTYTAKVNAFCQPCAYHLQIVVYYLQKSLLEVNGLQNDFK